MKDPAPPRRCAGGKSGLRHEMKPGGRLLEGAGGVSTKGGSLRGELGEGLRCGGKPEG